MLSDYLSKEKGEIVTMGKRTVLKGIFLVGLILFGPVYSLAHQTALKGGCAKINITPPVGVWLSGYDYRDRPSDGIADELYARALVLYDGRNTLAIVSADLLWIPLEITTKIREIVKEKIDIPGKNVLICATHTHFGPKIFSKNMIGPKVPDNKVDTSYIRTLIAKIVNSVLIAHKNMQDVNIGASKGEIPEIVYNRRLKNFDGSVKMIFSLPPEVIATRRIVRSPDGSVKMTFSAGSEEPKLIFGPIDPAVWVVRVEDMRGEIVGSIVNFACHAVSGSAHPDGAYSISADFPGRAMSIVEQMEGGTCLFTSGTAGDIVPIKRGKNARFQMGKALGGEILKRLQFVNTTGTVTLGALK